MTIPRLQSMQRYWSTWPPVSKLIASYFGAGKPPAKKLDDGEISDSTFAALMNDAAALNGEGNG